MGGNRYTKVSSPAVEAALDAALGAFGEEIRELRLPKLAAVVLGGGYGRGEGGVCRTAQGDRLYNDLDFFAFSRGADRAESRRIAAELAGVAAKWEERLGVAVDISPIKELSELPRVSGKLMYQELVRGWIPVWGEVDLAEFIPPRPPEALPFSEAARLILNRGMGLVFAGERLAAKSSDADFIMRNLHKSQLGGGDALLIAAGKYRWSGGERLDALREYVAENGLSPRLLENYATALHYKELPEPVLPDDPRSMWLDCRECFLEAARHVAGCADGGNVADGMHRRASSERSLRNFLRRILRRGPFRPLSTVFDPPEVTVAGRLFALLDTETTYPVCPQSLYRLWCKFN